MSFFDNIPRDDSDPPFQGEAHFSYLNRSARPEAARVREKADAWLATYPESHRAALVARFRSPINDQHRSAFFELFLYQLLQTRGCKIIAIEPALTHSNNSPDFLAENSEGKRFYVEAVQASGISNRENAAQARLNMALSVIDSTPSPLHFLDLKVTGTPTKPVSTKKLKARLKSWIAGLPPDETARQAAPFVWEEHGAKIQLKAWPRNKPDDGGRAIGVRWFPVTRHDPTQDIRPALKKKATRYGKLDHPYLVALNALSSGHSELAVTDALLGTSYIQISKGPTGEEVIDHLRRPDGIWYGPPDGQPQNTRLSGVLALMRIDPWNFASKRGLLIPNAWAEKPLPALGLGTAEFIIVDKRYERKEGKLMHELVGLPEDWPEE